MTSAPRALQFLEASEARGLRGLIFDLDDTILDHGSLSEAAYSSLFRLRESGLRLLACTGRPAGWAAVIARQWPIDAAIAENGAVAFLSTAGRVRIAFPEDGRATAARRVELEVLAKDFVKRFPSSALADDNAARMTDVTIDIGEHQVVHADDVLAMAEAAASRGVHTLVSSVHLHLSFEQTDKAEGALRLLETAFLETKQRALTGYAFVGDSGNDAAAFAAFQTTVGVANVAAWLPRLPVPPRYVTKAAMGVGFSELAAHLAALRAYPG